MPPKGTTTTTRDDDDEDEESPGTITTRFKTDDDERGGEDDKEAAEKAERRRRRRQKRRRRRRRSGWFDKKSSGAFFDDKIREEDGKRRRTKREGSSLCAPIVVLEGHEGAVNDVQFSTDGTVIGTGGNDRCVRLWSYDVEEGTTTETTTQKEKNSIENVAILRGHKNAVLSLAFLSDQFTIASASADKSIRVWDVEYGEQVKKYEKNHARAINCVVANERGASLIVSALGRWVL